MLIKNGYLIDPASGLEGICDVRIEGGTIIDVGILQPQMLEEVFDISGLTIAPGLIDTHVHFRDPGFTHKEDLHTGSLAAAKGGFTSVVCMANTKPAVDNVDTLKDILSRAKEEDIHIYQAASVTQSLKGQQRNDLKALAKAGACGFT
ncbi:MAG: amidohydrolase family protein, partial [Agathobacter sp.]|nr:amidohydrolase family protein [Agathobacter sp.]